MSQVLSDSDDNRWNVKLEIHEGKLFARQTADADAELYEIDLIKDRIDISLNC